MRFPFWMPPVTGPLCPKILDAPVRFAVRYAACQQTPPPSCNFMLQDLSQKVNGAWTEKALDQFSHFLRLRNLAPSDDELMTVLFQAKARYLDGPGHLSLCAAEPCRTKIRFDLSDVA